MNKTRVCVILSLMISYYLITQVLFPLHLPFFTPAGYILGLFFPFINKKHRIFVTFLYQTYIVCGFAMLIDQIRPTLVSIFLYEPVIETPSVDLFHLVLMHYHYPLYLGLQVLGYAFAYGFIVYYIFCLIAFFTQPYSIYLIYEKLGLTKRIERTFPHVSPRWWYS